jgi:PilZ domain
MSFFAELRRHIHRILLGEGRDFSQQRRHSRILCAVPVRLELTDHYTPGTLVDLSLDGGRTQIEAVPNRLGICRPPYRRGQRMKLVLAYSSTDRRDREAVVTIRWIRPSSAGWDVGFQLNLDGSPGWIPRLLTEYGLAQDAFHTRRTGVRAPTKQEIEIGLGVSQSFKGLMVDLSLGGAAVVSPKAFARFVPVRLKMQLAGKHVTLPAQVVHIRPHDEADFHNDTTWLCGMRFGELSRDEGELIGRHLVESRKHEAMSENGQN